MATQSNSPDEYVQTRHMSLQKMEPHKKVCNSPHPFPDRKPLQCQILRELEDEKSKIEDRS